MSGTRRYEIREMCHEWLGGAGRTVGSVVGLRAAIRIARARYAGRPRVWRNDVDSPTACQIVDRRDGTVLADIVDVEYEERMRRRE